MLEDSAEPRGCDGTRREYRRAQRQLDRWFASLQRQMPNVADAGLYEAASVVMMLLYRSGLRSGEAALIRFEDIVDRGDDRMWLRVKVSKSDAGIRSIDLASALDIEERARLRQWIDLERQRQELIGGFTLRNFVFADTNGIEPIGRTLLVAIIQAALVVGTGCPDARPHWFRHGHVMSLIAPLMFDSKIAIGLPESRSVEYPMLLPRLIAIWIRRRIGHAELSTSQRSYYHLQHLREAERDALRLASLPEHRWTEGTGIAEATLRKWRSRWCAASNIPSSPNARSPEDRIELAWAWAAHVAKVQGIPIEPNRVREAPLVDRLPRPPHVPEPFKLLEVTGLLADAQEGMRAEHLCGKYRIDQQRLASMLMQLLEISKRSREWVVSPQALSDLLKAIGRTDIEGLASLDEPAESEPQWEAIRKKLEHVMHSREFTDLPAAKIADLISRAFNSKEISAIGAREVEVKNKLTRAGLIGIDIKRRHSYIMLLSIVLFGAIK